MKNILFFDGLCNLCNHFVDMLLRIDKKHKITLAPLQGKTARKHNITMDSDGLESQSIHYINERGTWKASRAVFELLKDMDNGYSFLHHLRIIPSPISDAVYRMVAKYRYRIFGKKKTCRLPREDEKARFLD